MCRFKRHSLDADQSNWGTHITSMWQPDQSCLLGRREQRASRHPCFWQVLEWKPTSPCCTAWNTISSRGMPKLNACACTCLAKPTNVLVARCLNWCMMGNHDRQACAMHIPITICVHADVEIPSQVNLWQNLFCPYLCSCSSNKYGADMPLTLRKEEPALTWKWANLWVC